MATADEIAQYRQFLADEVDGVYLYEQLARIEGDPTLQDVYMRLAAIEGKHLAVWQRELRTAGADDRLPPPSFRVRMLAWTARRFGIDLVLPVIKSMESGAQDMYTGVAVAEAAGMPQDEQSHARVFAAIGSTAGRGAAGPIIGRLETRHRALGGGNALRASVLGANDGLVSNLALVAGFAGADPGQGPIILAGLAGLLAGASSMALGEWISVTSSREAAEAQLRVERAELELSPEAEEEELALIYQAKGLPPEDAQALARTLMADPDQALATMAREELGIVPEDLGSPWAAAVASFVLFAIGAIIPVIPFFFGHGLAISLVAAAMAGVGLFVLGAGITLLTGRNWLFGGARQVALGLAAAVVTYFVGGLIGGVAGI